MKTMIEELNFHHNILDTILKIDTILKMAAGDSFLLSISSAARLSPISTSLLLLHPISLNR